MSAYLDAVKLLGRRELSEAQLRQHLALRGHDSTAIDAAVARLRDEHTIDDARVAEMIARNQVRRQRGELQALRRAQHAGIADAIARRAVENVFRHVDVDALLQRALTRRLGACASIADRSEFERLYRYLTGQGFEAERVLKALEARRKPNSNDSLE